MAPQLTRRPRPAVKHLKHPKHRSRRSAGERTLLGLEFGTAAAALGGGILLAVRPDGAFLHTGPHVLRRTPFTDWRLPGLLLAAGCGGGYLAAGILQLRRHPAARPFAVAAGISLAGLEAWETAVIEFQPLEAVFAVVGAAVVVLALRLPAAASPGQGGIQVRQALEVFASRRR